MNFTRLELPGGLGTRINLGGGWGEGSDAILRIVLLLGTQGFVFSTYRVPAVTSTKACLFQSTETNSLVELITPQGGDALVMIILPPVDSHFAFP